MHNDLKRSLDFIFKSEKLHESQITLNKRRKPRKKTNLIPIIASFAILTIAAVVFYPFMLDKSSLDLAPVSTSQEFQSQQSEIFNYKGAYIGDHLSVGSIISYSLEDERSNGIQLYTYNEPFGVRAFMMKTMNPSTDYETIFTTASYLFTLIQNVDFVEFEYEDHVYKINKAEVELAFNLNYYSIDNEDSLRAIISGLLTNEPSMEIIQQLILTKPID